MSTQITNNALKQMAAATVKANITGSAAQPSDVALRAFGDALNMARLDIASAATVAIGAAASNYLRITGTTTITGFDTGIAAGVEREILFGGVLTLTYGANLLIPTGGNITTQAGDVAVFKSEGSNVWRCIDYTTASGASLTGGTGSGFQNFITNGGAETGITGWATYNNGAATKPTTGTGGAVTNLTLAQTLTNPISGVASFQAVKTANNIQGEGISYDFTIDRASLGRIQQIQATLEVVSGSIAAGDLTIWIYDKTNAVLIPVQPNTFPAAVVGASPLEYTINATFQTAINSTSYRLIFHFATTAALALTFNFDNVIVGPQIVSYGSPDLDWVTYSPTIGATTTPPTPGTNTLKAFWRRVGDSMQIRWEFNQTGAGSAGSGTYLFPLPAGYSVDVTKMSLNTAGPNGSEAGYGVAFVTGNAQEIGVFPYNTIYLAGCYTSGPGLISSSSYPLSNAVTSFNFEATVPILGWSSAVRMSNPDATRTVAFRMHNSSNQTGISTTPTQVVWGATDEDTHGSISGNTYVVPVSGYYFFTLNVTQLANTGPYANVYVYLRKNGTQVGGSSIFNNALVSDCESITEGISFLCNAGDVIDVYTYCSSGTFTVNSSSYLAGFRVAGPERIAASEKVFASYTNASGQSVGNSANTTITTWTKVADTHGAFNASTGVFTAPRAGYLRVEGALTWTANATGQRAVQAVQSGSQAQTVTNQNAPSSSINTATAIATTFPVQAGDQIVLQGFQSSGGALALIGGATYNWLSLTME